MSHCDLWFPSAIANCMARILSSSSTRFLPPSHNSRKTLHTSRMLDHLCESLRLIKSTSWMHVRCHNHSNFFPRRTSKYWAWKNLFLRMISTYFCNFSMLFSHYFHLSMSSDLGMWLIDLCHDLSKPLQSPNDQNQQQTKQWYIERHYANNNNCFLSNQNGHAGSYHI
jgi:hypothetical protein